MNSEIKSPLNLLFPQLPQQLLLGPRFQTFSGLASEPQCPFWSEGPRTGYRFWGVSSAKYKGRMRFLVLLATLFLIQTGCHWPSWPPGHTLACVQLLSVNITMSFSAGTLSNYFSPSLWCCLGLWPHGRTWHFTLLNSYHWPWPIDPACPDPSCRAFLPSSRTQVP